MAVKPRTGNTDRVMVGTTAVRGLTPNSAERMIRHVHREHQKRERNEKPKLWWRDLWL